MINSTNNFNFDSKLFKESELFKALANQKDDKFSKWVVRPLAALAALAMIAAVFFASAFLVLVSLAIAPLLALALWAMKKKIERDLAGADPVVSTQQAEEVVIGKADS